MNKLDKAVLKQQNALAAAIQKLQIVVKLAEDTDTVESRLVDVANYTRNELEALNDTYQHLYGVK